MAGYRQFNSLSAKNIYYYDKNTERHGKASEVPSYQSSKELFNRLGRLNAMVSSAETTTVVGGSSFFRKRPLNRQLRLRQEKAFEVYKKGAENAYRSALRLAEEMNGTAPSDAAVKLYHEHVGNATARQGYHALNDAWRNILSNGQAVYFDLEDLPDSDYSGRITEFSFQYVRKGTDPLGKTKWITEKGLQEAEKEGFRFDGEAGIPHEFNSIVGSTQEQYRKDLKLLEKFAHGKPVTEAERVMLGRFAMMGHRDTHILDDVSLTKRGIFRYDSFASAETAVAGGMSETDIRLGIEQLRDIGRKQQASPLVKWRGFSVRGHEAELLDAVAPVIERDVTLIGHNIMAHDIPMLNAYASGSMVSDGFREALKSMNIKSLDGNISILNRFDTLAALRTANADRMQLYSEPVLKTIAEKNLHLFSLEALGREYAPDFYKAGTAEKAMNHLASSDTRIGVEVTLNSGLFHKDGEKSLWKNSRDYTKRTVLEGGNRQLFMASRGTNLSEFGLWAYRHDAFSGRLRTTDGFSFGENGSVKQELFGQYVFQKEGTYSIQNIKKLTDKTFTEFIKKINPDLTGESLLAITFNVVETGELEGYRFRSPVTVFGTQDRMKDMLDSIFYHVADENGAGNYEAVNDSRMLRDLSREFYDPVSGKIRFTAGAAYDRVEFADRIIENATYRYRNESAARAVREFNFKKDSGTMAFTDSLEAMEKHREKGSGNIFDILEKSEKLAIFMSKGGTSPTGLETAGTLQGYLGFGSNQGGKEIYTETIDTAIARKEQIRLSRDLYLEAFKSAREKAGAIPVPHFEYIEGLDGVLKGNPWIDDLSASQRTAVEIYYRHLLKTTEESAVLKAAERVRKQKPELPAGEILSQARKIAFGELNRGAYLYQRDRFEVNLKGYKGITDDEILGINLKAGNLGLADILLKKTGKIPETLKDIDRVKELLDYQKWLRNKGIISSGRKEDRISLTDDNHETAAAKVLTGLKETRKKNPVAGNETGTFHIDTSRSMASIMETLGDEGLEKAFQEAEKTYPRHIITDFSKESLHRQAEELVDRVLFDSVSKEDLIKSGLDAERAEIGLRFRSVRRADTIGFVEKLMAAVLPNGGAISYDTDARKVFLLADGKQTEMDFLPRDIYHNGVFYRAVGHTKTADMVGFYSKYAGRDSFGNPLHKLGLSSRTGYAAESVGWLKSVVSDYAERGKLTEGVLKAGKIFAGTLRETSSAMGEDAQDAAFTFMFDMSGLLENIGELNDLEISTGNATDDDTIRDLIKRAGGGSPIPMKKLNAKQRQAVIRNESMLIKAALGKVWQDMEFYGLNEDIVLEDGTRTELFAEEKFYYGVKHRGEGQFMVRPAGDYGQNTTTDKRGIHNQVSRAIQFNRSHALSYLKDNGVEDVRFGASVSSALRAKLDTVIDTEADEYEKTVRIKRLAMDTESFRELINEGIEEGRFPNAQIADMLSTVHLDEGSALLDPRIADAAFSSRNSTQMVKLDSVFEGEDVNLHDLDFLLPEITVDADGSIRFRSGGGRFVRTGETWISKGSKESGSLGVKAKYDGVMRFGVFDKGGGSSKILGDRAVEILLNSEEAREYYKRHGHTAENAIEFLRIHTELAYYLNHAAANVNIKLASMGTEKGMYYALMSKTGMLDREIERFLDVFSLQWMKDISLSHKAIDGMALEDGSLNAAGDFAAMLHSASYRNTDGNGTQTVIYGEEAYRQAVSYIEEKFGGAEGLKKKLLAERNEPWQIFSGFLESKGLKGIHAVDNVFKSEEKHTDLIAYVNRALDALLELDEYRESPEKLVQQLIQTGAFKNLSINGDGRIIAPDEVEVNVAAMEKILSLNNIDSRREVEIRGKIVPADVAVTEYRQMQNYENARTYEEGSALGRSIRLNKRAVAVLSSDRFDDALKIRVKEGLESSLGKDGTALYNRFIGPGENGRAVASGVIEFLRENIYRDAEDGGKAFDFRSGFNVTNAGKVRFTGKVLEKLQEDGINREVLESMADLMAQTIGVKEAGYNSLVERYSAYSFSQADAYNISPTEEKLRQILSSKDAPQIIKLENLRSAQDGFSTRFLENIAQAQESLLDLHIESLGDSQIYSGESDRYIYLPYSKIVRMNEDGRLAADSYHKKLSLLENLYGELRDRLLGENGEILSRESEDIRQRLERMRSVATDIRQEIRITLTGKKGLLAAGTTARLSDSGIYDAYGIQLFGNEESEMLRKLNFRGINLVQEAGKSEKRRTVLQSLNNSFLDAEERWLKSGKTDSSSRALMDMLKERIAEAKADTGLKDGLEFDFTILDRKVMHRLYGGKLISDLGLSEAESELFREEIEKQLSTGGTIALNIREPQDKAKSTSTTVLFFGNTGGEDRALVSAMQQASKGGDFDSDKIESALVKSEAVISHNGNFKTVRIDQATYDVLNSNVFAEKGISAEWTQTGQRIMDSAMAATISNAAYRNKLYREKPAEIGEVSADGIKYSYTSFSANHLKDYTVEGTEGGTITTHLRYSSEESERLMSDYNAAAEKTSQWLRKTGMKDLFESSGSISLEEFSAQRAAIFSYLKASGAEAGTAEYNNVFNAVRFRLSRFVHAMEASTAGLKGGAGEMNYHIFRYLQLATGAVDENGRSLIDGDVLRDIMQVHGALGEAFLSPKNQFGAKSDRIEKLSMAFSDAYQAMSGNMSRKQAAENLKSAIMETLVERSGKELSKLPGMNPETFYGLEKDERDALIRENINRAAESYTSAVINSVSISGMDIRAYDITTTKGIGIDGRKLSNVSDGSFLAEQMTLFDTLAKERGRGKAFVDTPGPRRTGGSSLQEGLKEIREALKERDRASLGKAVEGELVKAAKPVRPLFSSALRSFGAKGGMTAAAIGVAAGLVTAGLASSPIEKAATPPPAETQAAGASEYQNDLYSVQHVGSFADRGLNSLRNAAGSGYVININAQSVNDRARAINAIQSSVGGVMPKSSVMNVSMVNSYREKVENRDLDDLIHQLLLGS